MSQKTGKKHPTVAIFSNDTDSGKSATKFQSISYKGAGCDVVGHEQPDADATRLGLHAVRAGDADG